MLKDINSQRTTGFQNIFYTCCEFNDDNPDAFQNKTLTCSAGKSLHNAVQKKHIVLKIDSLVRLIIQHNVKPIRFLRYITLFLKIILRKLIDREVAALDIF